MSAKFTNQEITAAIKAALAAMGEDYVYKRIPNDVSGSDGCLYAVGGQPSCIVGHVLHTLDPEMFEKVADYEENLPQYRDSGFGEVAECLDLPFDRDQVSALCLMQVAQDGGRTWSAAAREYEEYMGERL